MASDLARAVGEDQIERAGIILACLSATESGGRNR
jgi:hypothetical protein